MDVAENQTHLNFYGSPCYLARIKVTVDPLKMKMLEWLQQISHSKYMQIFSDTQGKLTPQSKVGSALN